MNKKFLILGGVLVVIFAILGLVYALLPNIKFGQLAKEHKTKWQEDIKSKNPKLYENLTQAINDLEKKVSENPNDVESLLELAATYQNFGDWQNAEKYYLKLQAVDENNFMLWGNLGRLYKEEGRYEKSKQAYLKMIKLFAGQPEGYLGLYGLYGEVSKTSGNNILTKEEVLYQVQQGYIVTQNGELKTAIDFLNKR